jgi:hypothetical protein
MNDSTIWICVENPGGWGSLDFHQNPYGPCFLDKISRGCTTVFFYLSGGLLSYLTTTTPYYHHLHLSLKVKIKVWLTIEWWNFPLWWGRVRTSFAPFCWSRKCHVSRDLRSRSTRPAQRPKGYCIIRLLSDYTFVL